MRDWKLSENTLFSVNRPSLTHENIRARQFHKASQWLKITKIVPFEFSRQNFMYIPYYQVFEFSLKTKQIWDFFNNFQTVCKSTAERPIPICFNLNKSHVSRDVSLAENVTHSRGTTRFAISIHLLQMKVVSHKSQSFMLRYFQLMYSKGCGACWIFNNLPTFNQMWY